MIVPVKNKISTKLIKYFPLIPIMIGISFLLIPDSNNTLHQEKRKNGIVSTLPTANVPFLRNIGQMEPEFDYYADIFGGRVFITSDAEFVYSLNTKVDNESLLTFKEQFIGSNKVSIKGEEESDIVINIFRGHDPAKWLNNIPAYKRISFNNIFNGIDLDLEAHGNNIEKVFKINPGTSAAEVKVNITGADHLSIGSNGELIVRASERSASFTKPVAFQLIENEKYFVLLIRFLLRLISEVARPKNLMVLLLKSMIAGMYIFAVSHPQLISPEHPVYSNLIIQEDLRIVLFQNSIMI